MVGLLICNIDPKSLCSKMVINGIVMLLLEEKSVLWQMAVEVRAEVYFEGQHLRSMETLPNLRF